MLMLTSYVKYTSIFYLNIFEFCMIVIAILSCICIIIFAPRLIQTYLNYKVILFWNTKIKKGR